MFSLDFGRFEGRILIWIKSKTSLAYLTAAEFAKDPNVFAGVYIRK